MPKHHSQRVKQGIADLNEGRFTEYKDEEEFLAAIDEIIESSKITRCKIVSCIDAKIKITGRYSGREYLFERAGSVVDVDQIDVDFLLEKRQGERQCCGGTDKGNKIFALA